MRRLVEELRTRSTAVTIACIAAAFLPAAAKADDQAASVAEASVVVGASPFSPLLNGVLADPLFLPAKGKLYGSGVSTLTLASSDVYDGAGALLYARDRHDIDLSHSLAYGLTPRLSLHGSLGYSFDYETDTTPTGLKTKSTSRSIDNSGIGFTWRAITQKHRPFVLDVAVNYSPTFFIPDPSLRQAVNASVGVGRAMRDLTVQVIGTATLRPAHHYTADDGKTDIDQGAAWNYGASLRTQFRFSRSFATDVSVNYAMANNGLTIDHADDLSSNQEEPAAITLSTGLNYQVLQNKLAIGVYYSHQFWGDSGTTSSDPSQTSFTRNEARDVISTKIYYVVN